MTVAQLIQQLQTYPQEAEIAIWTIDPANMVPDEADFADFIGPNATDDETVWLNIRLRYSP